MFTNIYNSRYLLCVPCRVPLPTAATYTVLTSSSFRLLRSILSLRTFCLVAVLLLDSLSLIYAVTQNWSTNQSTALHDQMLRIAEYCRLSLQSCLNTLFIFRQNM